MSKELKIGLVSLLIIGLGIWGYNFLKGQSLFQVAKRHFKTEYSNVEGLSEASIVTINGKPVGKVTNIDFHPSKKDKMLVEFVMDNDIEFAKTSIAKMYTSSLVTGGQNIAIIPKYDGEIAVSGDTLKGIKDLGMLGSVQDKLAPLQSKIDAILINADSLMGGFNKVLDTKAQESLNRSVVGLERTLNQMNKALVSANGILDKSKEDLSSTLKNTKKITDDFSKVSGNLSQADLGKTFAKLETTLQGVNAMLADMKNGKGSLGKLMTDDKMYVNLTNASKEMEELLREMKLNPKRFVHFSLFGKRPKPYNQANNHKNISNK